MPWNGLAESDSTIRKASARQAFHTNWTVVDTCVAAIAARADDRPQPNEHIVDFACGTNYFADRLIDSLERSFQYTCRSQSFDICLPTAPEDVRRRASIALVDFLSVTRADMERTYGVVRHRVVVGFNPPFGFRSKRLRQFVEHAIVLVAPRRIYLVHQRRFYCPPGYTTTYQCILPRRAFFTLNTDDGHRRAFEMYGCFFSIFADCLAAPGNLGIRTLTDALPPWIVDFDHMRPVYTADTLVLLRTGSRCGQFCAALDHVTGCPTAIFHLGVRTTTLPSSSSSSHLSNRARLNSFVYYKIRISPERLDAYSPLTTEQLARRLSMLAPLDRSKNDSFPPYISRTHVVRCLDRIFLREATVGMRILRDRERARPLIQSVRDPFDGDIRDYMTS